MHPFFGVPIDAGLVTIMDLRARNGYGEPVLDLSDIAHLHDLLRERQRREAQHMDRLRREQR